MLNTKAVIDTAGRDLPVEVHPCGFLPWCAPEERAAIIEMVWRAGWVGEK